MNISIPFTAALAVAWLLTAAPLAWAQGQPTPAAAPTSKVAALRTVIEQPGRVVITRSSALEPVPLEGGGELRVSAVGAFEPGQEAERVLGLRLDLVAAALPSGQVHHYLDVHEIEDLIKAIFLLDQVVSEAREGFESEADYETLEGFVIGANVQRGKVSYWVEGGGRLRLGLSRNHVTTFRQRLEVARTRLFTE